MQISHGGQESTEGLVAGIIESGIVHDPPEVKAAKDCSIRIVLLLKVYCLLSAGLFKCLLLDQCERMITKLTIFGLLVATWAIFLTIKKIKWNVNTILY